MKLYIVFIGKEKSKHFDGAINDYLKRIGNYIKLKVKVLTPVGATRSMDVKKATALEGKALIEFVSNLNGVVYLLDEKGKEYSSPGLADLFQKNMNSGVKSLTLVIGGAYGFSDEVYSKFPQRIALSQLTLPHELARLLLTEQVYRAFAILNNQPYHHD